jgi:plasmid stabilization system protein ParE
MRIEIVKEAMEDLLQGYRFYEDRAQGLGDYFLDSLFSDIDSLQIYAGVHALQFGYMRILSKRFPFAIYYRKEIDIVRVFAVLDCRRDPAEIRRRLM